MAPCPDWKVLLKDLGELHNLWLNRARWVDGDKARIRGIVFGIEVGSNRIAEEVANANPAVAAILAAWREHLNCREEADGREIIKGVDYGIQLVIDCVERFFERTNEPYRSEPNTTNGDESKDTS